MLNKIKQIVLLSDLHIGSTVGLWPTRFISQEGVPIGQNKYQQWLYKCWMDLHGKSLPEYLGKDPYAVVLNGDCIDGTNPRSTQYMTPNVSDQMTACQAVLSPITILASKVFVTKGTESHTHDKEVMLGRSLGAIQDKTTGQHAFDKLHLVVEGTNCLFKHHIGTAMRPYLEATQFSTELGAERIEAARCGHPIPDVLCSAHRHRHGIFRDAHGLVCITGGWQGATRYVHRIVGSAAPSPSCIVLDWRGRKPGSLPATEEFVYISKPPEYLNI